MSIIKERIKFENQDINLKFTLDENVYRFGYQQEIDNLTEQTKSELINPIVDNEVKRFKYKSTTNTPTNIFFYFTTNGTTYKNSFLTDGAGYTTSEVSDYDTKLRNSFFIMDFYDNFNDYTQNKYFTVYQTQILDGEKSGSTPIPKYRIFSDTVNQLYHWYVPLNYINDQLNNGLTTVIGYVRFSFYNAKTGQMLLFYNKSYAGVKTSERLYVKTELNLSTMTWRFLSTTQDINAYQVPINDAFAQRVNNTVDKFDNKKQEYPAGNTFDASTGDYETT